MRIHFSEIALDELDSIKVWIARDSQHYANLFIEKVFTFTEKLENHPKLGRVVPELDRQDIRELIFRNYRIIYKIKNNTIIVLTVIHAARFLKNTGSWLID